MLKKGEAPGPARQRRLRRGAAPAAGGAVQHPERRRFEPCHRALDRGF